MATDHRKLTVCFTFGSPPRGSITEGTTELLISNIKTNEHGEGQAIPRKALDTGEVDDERLM